MYGSSAGVLAKDDIYDTVLWRKIGVCQNRKKIDVAFGQNKYVIRASLHRV